MPSPSNGSTNFSGSSANQIGNYIFNVVATYNCDTGFSLVGNSSRTCTGNDSSIMGFFDWSAPTCEGECMLDYFDILFLIYMQSLYLPYTNAPLIIHCKKKCAEHVLE